MTSPRFERPKALAGRSAQGARLNQLLADARAGQSAVLVLRGEPGMGKTALLGYAAESAQGFQVARAAGVESEMELPFAGLHQLCRPMAPAQGVRQAWHQLAPGPGPGSRGPRTTGSRELLTGGWVQSLGRRFLAQPRHQNVQVSCGRDQGARQCVPGSDGLAGARQ
jgi:hypothetical protein